MAVQRKNADNIKAGLIKETDEQEVNVNKDEIDIWQAIQDDMRSITWIVNTYHRYFEGSFLFAKEDLMQVAMLGAVEGMKHYRKDGGASVPTYIIVCANIAIRDYINRNSNCFGPVAYYSDIKKLNELGKEVTVENLLALGHIKTKETAIAVIKAHMAPSDYSVAFNMADKKATWQLRKVENSTLDVSKLLVGLTTKQRTVVERYCNLDGRDSEIKSNLGKD